MTPDSNAIQKSVETKLKQAFGELVYQNSLLQAQLELLQAQLEIRKGAPKLDTDEVK